MQLPITIGLHRSFLGLAGMALVHGLAVIPVALVPWPVLPKIAAFAGLAASFLFSWRLVSPGVTAIRLGGDGRVACRLTGEEAFRDARLLPGATVHPWLTVIRLTIDGRTLAVAAFPDSAAPEELRRLRIWLRWRAEFSAGEASA